MHRSNTIFSKVALLAALFFLAILGYVYWHEVTHGSLYVWLEDISDKNHALPIKNAEIIFLDSSFQELARGKSDDLYGTVYLSSPRAYSCREAERSVAFSLSGRDDWRECFEKQSRWLMTWIRRVNFAKLKVGDSNWGKIPVKVSEYSGGWWLWWVPLRHIGGKPYTSFYIHLSVNASMMTG